MQRARLKQDVMFRKQAFLHLRRTYQDGQIFSTGRHSSAEESRSVCATWLLDPAHTSESQFVLPRLRPAVGGIGDPGAPECGEGGAATRSAGAS